MRRLIRTLFARFRRTASYSGNAASAGCLLKLPDECIVDVMLFMRRTDVDTASLTCRCFHRILTAVAMHLPLRYLKCFCLDFENEKRRHQVLIKEQQGSPWQRLKIRRIRDCLSRLSHCHIEQLNVHVHHLNKFDWKKFRDDIAHFQHTNFRVKNLAVSGKSKSTKFDVCLYNFLLQPGRMPENIALYGMLPDAIRLGLEIPEGIVGGFCGVDIVKEFVKLPHSLEPVRFIFAYADHELRGFEYCAGFESSWPDGNYREAEKWVDGVDTTLVVYRPLVNHRTGQKLRVMAMQPSDAYYFGSEERLTMRKEVANFAEANCIILFVVCRPL